MLRLLARLALLCGAALPLAAQKREALANGDPRRCPYCAGDPAQLERAGLVSHGPFEFGRGDTREVDERYGGMQILWLESKHFELGMASRPFKLTGELRKRVTAELVRLQQVLPAVDPKVTQLDPWLRLHLYAQRCEDLYATMQRLLRVSDADFPDGKTLWDGKSKFMGAGPYLGQKGKYELLVLPSQSSFEDYLQWQFGLIVTQTQRYHLPETGTLTVTMNAGRDDLREEPALHGHVAFTVAQNLLVGYKHFSYDTPAWILEGLAHWFEREVDPRNNTFDGSEGSLGNRTSSWRWEPEVIELIQRGKAPRMAELARLADFGDFEVRHHLVCWSMVDYLIEQHPEGFACLNDALHGRTGPDLRPDGSNMLEAQREAFERCLGLRYADFDTAWSAWALKQTGNESEGR